MIWYVLLIAAVAAERLVELVVSKRNWAWSRARGGTEFGAGHYPVMVVLHTALLVGCLVEAIALHRPFIPALGWPMLAVVVAAQVLRWWCITTLGHQWNTRVIVVPGAARVTGGPYRLIPHPNYVAVVVEGIALPLVHTAWITAVVFTVLNAALLQDPDQGGEHGAGEPDVIDLLVGGGGPAGLATALYGARAGLEVVVVERRAGVLDKACGEGHDAAHPRAPGAPRRSAAQGRPLRGITLPGRRPTGRRDVPRRDAASGCAGRCCTRRCWRPPRRRACDSSTTTSARSPRTRNRCARASCAPATSPRPTACTPRSVARWGWRSRAAARADGESAATCRSRRGPTRSRCTGRRGAEAYVTPVADDCVGIAILSPSRGGFDGHFDEFPALLERVERPRPRPGPRGGPAAAEGAQPDGGTGAARRRRGGLHRRVDRRGHGAGVRRRRTAGGLRRRRPTRRLRPAVAPADAALPAAHGGAGAGGRPRRGPARIVPAATMLPGVFAAMVDQLAA